MLVGTMFGVESLRVARDVVRYRAAVRRHGEEIEEAAR